MLYLYITTIVSCLKTYLSRLSFSREKIKINLIFRQEKKAVVLHFLRSLLCEIRITWHIDFNVFVSSRETNIISYIGMSVTALPIPLNIWFNLHSFRLFWKSCRYVFLLRLLYNPFFWVHDKYISNVTFYRWRI